MVIKALLNDITKKLNNYHEAQMIICDVLKLTITDLILKSNESVSKTDEQKILNYTKERIQKKPLQYILNNQEFMSLLFKVNSDVLIPRSDTETLVEEILKNYKNKINVLDIGAGTGCIGISIAYYNKNAFVTEVDISDKALNIARENAVKNEVNDRMNFILCDIMSDIPDGCFDVIVSNPPYIEHDVIATLDDEVKNYEPHFALDGGEDGLDFYRRITKIAPLILKKGGTLWYEVGYNQAQEVCDIMKNDFSDIRIIKDLCGVNRVVVGILK